MNGVALCVGGAFGFLLAWARITEYDTIARMLLLREPDLYLLMGSAVAVAAVGVRLLSRLGARARSTGAPLVIPRLRATREHVAGAALFGIGWALAGTCPGPALAQLGLGRVPALVVVLGIFAGLLVRGAELRRRPAEQAAEPAGSCAGL